MPLNEPFSSARQCIVVPRTLSNGLLTAVHLKLNHPSAYQLKQVIRRFFFMLDLDNVVFWTLYFDDTVFYLRRNNNVVMEKGLDCLRNKDEYALALQQCLPIVY